LSSSFENPAIALAETSKLMGQEASCLPFPALSWFAATRLQIATCTNFRATVLKLCIRWHLTCLINWRHRKEANLPLSIFQTPERSWP
jgi:hypothetical protein